MSLTRREFLQILAATGALVPAAKLPEAATAPVLQADSFEAFCKRLPKDCLVAVVGEAGTCKTKVTRAIVQHAEQVQTVNHYPHFKVAPEMADRAKELITAGGIHVFQIDLSADRPDYAPFLIAYGMPFMSVVLCTKRLGDSVEVSCFVHRYESNLQKFYLPVS